MGIAFSSDERTSGGLLKPRSEKGIQDLLDAMQESDDTAAYFKSLVQTMRKYDNWMHIIWVRTSSVDQVFAYFLCAGISRFAHVF